NVVEAYRDQIELVEGAGDKDTRMASHALVQAASGAEDYLQVYTQLLKQVHQPVILHWLGTMFDPALVGYWGSENIDVATETFLVLININADKVDGVKVSILDAELGN